MPRARTLIVLVAAGLSAASAACRKPAPAVPDGGDPGPPPPAATGPGSEPRIWIDAEATKVAQLAARLSPSGGDVSVYRWENGFVEGWVQFDGEGRPGRTPLDFQRPLVKQLADREGGRVPAAHRLSGMAVVGKTKVDPAGADGGDDWYDCQVVIQLTWADADGGPHGATSIALGPVGGRVRLARGRGPRDPPPPDHGAAARREGQQIFVERQSGRTAVQLLKGTGVGTATDGPVWMELRVVAPGG